MSICTRYKPGSCVLHILCPAQSLLMQPSAVERCGATVESILRRGSYPLGGRRWQPSPIRKFTVPKISTVQRYSKYLCTEHDIYMIQSMASSPRGIFAVPVAIRRGLPLIALLKNNSHPKKPSCDLCTSILDRLCIVCGIIALTHTFPLVANTSARRLRAREPLVVLHK